MAFPVYSAQIFQAVLYGPGSITNPIDAPGKAIVLRDICIGMDAEMTPNMFCSVYVGGACIACVPRFQYTKPNNYPLDPSTQSWDLTQQYHGDLHVVFDDDVALDWLITATGDVQTYRVTVSGYLLTLP